MLGSRPIYSAKYKRVNMVHLLTWQGINAMHMIDPEGGGLCETLCMRGFSILTPARQKAGLIVTDLSYECRTLD